MSDAAPIYLTTAEVAALLKVTEDWLARMRFKGTGPRYYKLGDSKRAPVLYKSVEVKQWLESRGHNSTAEY